MTFSCVSSGEENAAPGQEVLFHFSEGYLFLQNETGAAQNVCSQAGTVECNVKMTRKQLTLEQSVEAPYCGFRAVVKTSLDIDRASGAFRLVQEACEPRDDRVVTGTCQSR